MSVEPIERKSGRVWRVRWRDHNGRGRSRVIGRKADAIAYDSEIRRKRRTGELATHEAGAQTLAAFVEEWWVKYALPNLAQRTRDSYAKLWDKHVLPDLGDLPLREVSASQLEGHLAVLRSRGVGAPTVHRVSVLLSSVLQRAFEWGRLSENPCRRVRSRAPDRQRVINPLTVEQVESLRDACWRPRDRFIVGMIAYGGLRPSELMALRWDDVTLKHITVNKATDLNGIKGTKNRVTRRVNIRPELHAVLLEWVAEDGMDTETVIAKWNGQPFTDYTWQTWHKDVWQPILGVTGIKAVPYDLRHTFVSTLLAEGADVVTVAKQAGNEPATTLKVYAHCFDGG